VADRTLKFHGIASTEISCADELTRWRLVKNEVSFAKQQVVEVTYFLRVVEETPIMPSANDVVWRRNLRRLSKNLT